MPDHEVDDGRQIAVEPAKQTLEQSPAVDGNAANEGDVGTFADGRSPTERSATIDGAQEKAAGSRLLFRDGMAYVEGCDIPVWRLEMARRLGSSCDAQLAVFPGLTSEGLDLAFAYAEKQKAEFDPLIHHHSGADVTLKDEGGEEDEAAFEAELEAMFVERAEVFRRLAQ
jgi:uncharacterized protein (DUF433 family)